MSNQKWMHISESCC